jgi:hypothetical protein
MEKDRAVDSGSLLASIPRTWPQRFLMSGGLYGDNTDTMNYVRLDALSRQFLQLDQE